MSFLTSGVGSLIGGVASGVGSLIGSSESSSASKDAANAQLQMYYNTASNLAPYNAAGQSAAGSALSLAQGSPTGGGPDYITQASQNMPYSVLTEQGLQQTPGYQFTLNQGNKAVQAANAARGLGVSGAALKGIASYTTGLADQTYQNQFNDAQTQFQNYLNLNTAQQGNLQNQFNRLSTLAGTGENAAAQTGAQGTQAASNYGNYLSQAGQTTGAGTVTAGNALSSSLNNYSTYNLLQQYLQNQSGQMGGYTPATFGNNTGYSTGGFYGGNSSY